MSYTKQGFYKGMTLEHTHLINIEDGIINATSTQIPPHWQSYMDDKVSEINTLNESSGGNADNFIFITDTHLPEYNNGNSISLVKYLLENTSIDKVIFGGDTIHPSSASVGLSAAKDLKKSLRGVKYFMMRGNHDSDYNSENQYYDILYRSQADYCEMSSNLDYYWDNKAQKIRYIMMDTTASGTKIATSNSQVQWMKSLILELDEDWSVLVLRHSIWNPVKNGTISDTPIDDVKTTINALDEIYDTAKCNIIGILAGHVHRDKHMTTDKGYVLITTTCDSSTYSVGWDTDNSGREVGTTNEQAFDVVNLNPMTGTITMIRIGAGDDRTITYNIPRDYLDLSSLTWEQGHYDNSTGQNTTDTHSYYKYRLRSNVIEIPEEAKGKTLYFDVDGDYEINFHAGTSSNGTSLSSVLYNYYLITSDKSVLDRGSNSGNRGYAVKLPSNATHVRMMMSHDNGMDSGSNNSKEIVPSDASNAKLKIWYK